MTDRDRDRPRHDRDRPDADWLRDQRDEIIAALAAIDAKVNTLTNKSDYQRRLLNAMSDATTTAFTDLSAKVDTVIAGAQAEEAELRAMLATALQDAIDARAEAEVAKADDAADDAAVAAAEDRATTAEGVAAALQTVMDGFETNVLTNIAAIGTKVTDFGATTQPAPAPEVPTA